MTKSVTVTFLFRLEGLKLNDTDWINDFKEKRTQYGVSQNRLAVMAGISREYVSRIESGKVALTEEIKGKFTDALEKLNPENPLEMVLDYVRIRFPTQDVRHVVEDILQLKLDVMIHEDYGFYRNLTIPTGGAFLPFPMLHLSIYESLLFQIMDFHRLTNTVGCSLTTE